jgi:hypothetical protein
MRIVTPFRQFTSRAANEPASGGAATDTWNPSDKDAGITLSNGNLTATYGSTSTPSVRSVNSHATGKYHFEYTIVNPSNNQTIGLKSGSEALSTYVGGATTSLGVNVQGSYYFNASPTGLAPAPPSPAANWNMATGNVIAIEIDLDGGNLYVQNFTTGAPRSNAVSLASLTGSPWFLGCSVFNATAAFTINTGGSAYSVTPTSGYGNW